MKIVILEADSLGQDMVFTPFEALGDVVIYPATTAGEMEEKTKDADVIVANKVPICEATPEVNASPILVRASLSWMAKPGESLVLVPLDEKWQRLHRPLAAM